MAARPSLVKSRGARLSALTILTGLLVLAVIGAWIKEKNAAIVSAASLEPSFLSKLSYLEIQLSEQEPREPIFKGNFFLYFGLFKGQPFSHITVKRSGAQTYGTSVNIVDMVLDQTGDFRTQKREDFDIITTAGRHNLFPFDSSNFDFEITLEPDLPIHMIRVVNHVPGFLMDSEGLRVSRNENRSIHLVFQLKRDPFIQLLSVVLAVASIVFAALVLSIRKPEVLATSVASFFFSLWSIRGIMGSEVRTFPTLLDYWLLMLCCLVLLILIWRFALQKRES